MVIRVERSRKRGVAWKLSSLRSGVGEDVSLLSGNSAPDCPVPEAQLPLRKSFDEQSPTIMDV